MLITEAKPDAALKLDVLAELEFDPSVKLSNIGVLVKEGVVTLNGFAASHGEKLDALRAVKRVAGVLAIADEIEVNLPAFGRLSDSDLAASAAHRINWTTEIPPGAVLATVRDGRITLEGVVQWGYQKHAAEAAVQSLAGVKAVTNEIELKPGENAADIDQDLTSAIRRNAILDEARIQVETSGSTVTLKGKVHNHAELDEAVRLAWAAPGVHSVDNQLKVEWFWGLVD